MFERVATTCALVLLLIAPTFGQTSPAPAPASAALPSGSSAADQSGSTFRSRLLGATVIDADHEVVGVINDLVIGPQGRAQTAIIGLGGFLGLGEKDVAVPFADLSLGLPALSRDVPQFANARYAGSSPERVLLPMTFKQLSAAPAFKAPNGATGVPSGTAGTPEGTNGPKSSTESGGPG